MTKLLEQAIDKAQHLPPEMQDEMARMMLAYAGEEEPVYVLSAEEADAVQRSREAAARGEFATDEEMEAIWAKYDL